MSRRLATVVAAGDIAVMFMGSTLLTPLYVLYQEDFGFSGTTLTLVYSTYAVGNLIALFVLGRLSDQLGRMRTLLPAIALAGVATLVFLLATSTPWLFVGRAVSGVAIGLAAGAATAWISELSDHPDRTSASATTTTANFSGLAIGSLLAGLLARYALAPLRLIYIVYLVLLAALAALVVRSRETVKTKRALAEVSLRPRIGVPRDIRARFVSPAATAFAVFALGGFYAALTPTLLRHTLHQTSPAVGGALVCELFGVAAIAVIATRAANSRAAMLSGAALLVPSVALLVIAQVFRSFPVLLIGLAVTGVSFALGYRGSLEAITRIAPADRRAEVISSYQIVCFASNAVPVVGVGVLSALFGAVTATVCLAILVVALSALALVTELRHGQHS